ncbi:MAG: electron transporter RnfD [Butyrivibrio sp.]|nr:electron transporter RnfD [Butyrivibrio sp.]
MRVYPDNPKLQYSGRIDFDNPKEPVLVFAATYIKIKFTGASIKACLDNRRNCWSNYMGVIADGVQSAVELADGEGKYLLADGLGEGVHELMLFKRQDSCHYVVFKGFELEDGAELLEMPPLPERRIEVFGDSVSCGEVSEALDYVGKADPEHNGEFSNSWYSYSWLTARRLNAELHDTSQGGIALLDGTGYFNGPDDLRGMESSYDKIQYNPFLGELKPWDFSKWQPHVVIAAIGQNDANPVNIMAEDYDSEASVSWRARYKAWIERLAELYPSARIILTTTILMHDPAWDRAIDEVCGQIGSGRVTHFMYKRNGAGTPGHIRIPEAEEMSGELAAYIEGLGEEIWNG